MLKTENRIDLLCRLGAYMLSNETEWQMTKEKAAQANAWFTPESIDTSINNIVSEFLKKDKLQHWISEYEPTQRIKMVGIVMAGNIPLVGFHDFLCGFMSGHKLKLKPSSKDEILISHLAGKLTEWQPELKEEIQVSELLKDCDAYIATGSNNTARYFESYFRKYPNIIRRNRTSVAILDGTETEEDLTRLASDVFTYFGLGCRNITQVMVPEGYDFQKLLDVFAKHQDIMTHSKYKNNYDYYLAIYLLNKIPYLTNGSILLIENPIPFSAVGVMHYRYYNDKAAAVAALKDDSDIQCIAGHNNIPFGNTQRPGLTDYADGVDVMKFLSTL